MNPAALSAAMRGDLANVMVASTPGGIEAQEAAGQATLVADGAMLPKDMHMHPGLTREMVTEATGIVFGADSDDLFVRVTLPAGWKLQATDHSMWSKLLDSQGRERAAIFYKAAFYDRNAHLRFTPRYSVTPGYDGTPVAVEDSATGATLFSAGTCADADYKARDKLRDEAEAWLVAKFPDHRNPLAYWPKD